MFECKLIDRVNNLEIPNGYEYIKSINFDDNGNIYSIETEFVNVSASGEPYMDKSVYVVGDDDFEFYVNGKRIV